jgi:hypothetical protein
MAFRAFEERGHLSEMLKPGTVWPERLAKTQPTWLT